jgi:hypothetical protein
VLPLAVNYVNFYHCNALFVRDTAWTALAKVYFCHPTVHHTKTQPSSVRPLACTPMVSFVAVHTSSWLSVQSIFATATHYLCEVQRGREVYFCHPTVHHTKTQPSSVRSVACTPMVSFVSSPTPSWLSVQSIFATATHYLCEVQRGRHWRKSILATMKAHVLLMCRWCSCLAQTVHFPLQCTDRISHTVTLPPLPSRSTPQGKRARRAGVSAQPQAQLSMKKFRETATAFSETQGSAIFVSGDDKCLRVSRLARTCDHPDGTMQAITHHLHAQLQLVQQLS